jgi:hypothetical protein
MTTLEMVTEIVRSQGCNGAWILAWRQNDDVGNGDRDRA